MKKIYFILGLSAILAAGCGGQKQLVKPQEDVEVVVPWFRTGIYDEWRIFQGIGNGLIYGYDDG